MVLDRFKIWRRLALFFPVFGLFLVFTTLTTPVKAASGINQEINFQGRLLTSEGATVPDGFYNIEFKIYQDGDGQSAGDATGSPAGSLKWTEDYLNANSQGVVVKNGFLSVQLGSVTPFGSSIDWNQSNLWLSMNIGGTGTSCSPFSTCSPDGEMTPLKRLSSTPYALNSGLLGGLASSQFIQIAQGVQTDANSDTSSIYINKTNTGNLLQLQSGGNDAFVLSNSGDVSFGANANHTISVATAGAGVAGKSLTLTGGAAGTGGTALAGGNLSLQGGSGGGTNGAGGNIAIDAGAHNGSGTDGAISIGTNTASSVSIAKAGVTTTVGGSLTVASGNLSLTSGAYQVNGTPVIDSSRNLTNIGTITSGNINSQTISSTANFTGTLNAATGFKIGGLAVTGTFLRGDGTNYVGSNILAADVPSGSTYYINNSTSAQANANLYIRSAGSGSVGAVIEGANGQSADLLRLNTYNGTSSSTVAKVDNAGNLTAGTYNGQTISAAANFTGTMTVQGASVTIGHGTTDVTGSLKLDTTTGRMVVIQGLTPTGSGDATIQFPSIAGGSSDTVCLLTAANCTANVVQKSSGTQNFLPKWSNAAATSIGNSEIFDNGSGVSIGSTTVTGLFNVGASNQFQVSSAGAVTAVGLNSGTGLIQGTAGLTVAGTIKLSSINTAGILHADATGVLTSSAVVLGSETSGNYVATLGILTGLTASGNSGAGSTPTLSVNYGNSANTAAQGNTALTFNGSGNLTGAISGTAGGGFTTTSLTVVDNPTFTGLITGQAATTALALTGTPTPGSGVTSLFQLGNVISGGNTAANGGTYFGINLPGSGAGSAADILNFQANGNSKLKVTNTGAVTAAGQLTISSGGIAVSGNSTIAGTLGSLTGITSSGSITFSGLNVAGIVHNSAAGLLSTGAVALGTDTTGNYVASLGALVGLTTSGNSGAGATPTLSVRYGAISGSAVQGDTALICPSGTGNLSGTGNTITLGSGGTCNALTVVNNPTFSGLVSANGGLSIGSSSTFTNASSTLNSAMALGSISGSIGLATATVDIATSFTINMIASGQTITIPDPTNTTAGRIIYISNIGSQSFTLLGTTINPNTSATLIWNGTVWTFGGADGSSILNQSAVDQTANFRVSGSGRAATSFLSPQFDVASSGTLSLGTGSFATAISIGKSGITTTNLGNLQVGASGTLLTSAGAISAASTITGTTLNGTTGINTGVANAGAGTQRIDNSGNLLNIGNLTTSGASTFATTGATGFAFKPGSDNGTAFQVQNAGGASILVVDSSNRQLKVMENGGSTNYALIYYDTATATANYTASSGTVAVGTGAGSISVVAGSSAAVTITANAASTWKTTAGSLTLQSGSGSDLILNAGSSVVSVNGSSVIKLGSSAGDPGTCTVGAIVYNSTSNLFRGCQGSSPAWVTLGTATPTLQSVYTASTGGTTPEIKVDSTRGGLDIQDADSTIGGVLFSVRGSNIAGLGTNLFNVNSSNNTINIGTSDTAGTLLVLDTDTDSTFNGGTAGNAESVVNGAMFYSSTDHNFMCGTAGKWLTCNGLLYSNTAVSASIGNCTTACGAFSTANSSAVPANYCQPGRVIRISAKGVYSTTLAPSLQFGIYYGTDGSNRANDTLIGTTSGAVTTATSVSNFGWGLDYSIVCFSTTSMNGQGTAYVATATTATTTSLMYTNGATTGLSTNAAKNFYIFPTWGTASASNNVTAQQLIISGQ